MPRRPPNSPEPDRIRTSFPICGTPWRGRGMNEIPLHAVRLTPSRVAASATSVFLLGVAVSRLRSAVVREFSRRSKGWRAIELGSFTSRGKLSEKRYLPSLLLPTTTGPTSA
ncbi:unnamed protein product, partial [Nesidiocoris tenuis]